ncbi:MAG: DEAD/DEAH box helicase [Tuberibacillus sp.]
MKNEIKRGDAFPRHPLLKAPAANFLFNPDLQKFLWGRKLLFEECHPFSPKLIEMHIEHHFIASEPGIAFINKLPYCQRCGNSDPELFGAYDCARCGKLCYYCRACLTMGTIKTCSRLLTWIGPPPDLSVPAKVDIKWSGHLSPLQVRASSALKDALYARKDFLIWAVTGAGKTEILYEALREALLLGYRVGIVSPRTDVVIEISTRMKKIFSDVPIVTLYGDSPDTYSDVPLIFSTTHQLLRFDQRFDVFFIDEVDAFPFHNNPMLERALKQAGTDKALRFYLTATPTEKLKRRLKEGTIGGVKIQLRFHGHPLPEPRFQWIGDWQKPLLAGKVPPKLKRWIDRQLRLQRPAFIFVPSIVVAERLAPLLKHMNPAIEGVHSEDPQRHEKVKAFRQGDIPILVTTTILERGVTIPFLDVAVLGSDEAVFDERALVQIGGRVGRAESDPTGDLVFFHHGITLEMMKALRHIREMNREGKKL